MICATLAEVTAAGEAYGASMPPLTDEQVAAIAPLLAPYWPKAAQPQPRAA